MLYTFWTKRLRFKIPHSGSGVRARGGSAGCARVASSLLRSGMLSLQRRGLPASACPSQVCWGGQELTLATVLDATGVAGCDVPYVNIGAGTGRDPDPLAVVVRGAASATPPRGHRAGLGRLPRALGVSTRRTSGAWGTVYDGCAADTNDKK